MCGFICRRSREDCRFVEQVGEIQLLQKLALRAQPQAASDTQPPVRGTACGAHGRQGIASRRRRFGGDNG